MQQKKLQSPNRYSEAGLVKELEERGIGRPSTYASIMRTLEERGYVKKRSDEHYIQPTQVMLFQVFLKPISTYISDTFTAEMENELDEIANGERQYIKLFQIYTPFSAEVAEKDKLKKQQI
ncbi:MAG: hypothetical protein IPO32_18480 [Crocinitomicaceae bacterium]|nr:hypothetical protein [Crocinitomicaceae bacterium]